MIKCKILPPKNLYHPVLPQKIQCGQSTKLLFPLCRTCAENKIQECHHNETERELIGTWCLNEMHKALEKGYEIQKIYEVWNFEETTDDIFKEYVKKFLKIKLESSGLKTGEGCKYKSHDEFKQIVFDKLGIKLGEIEYNAGKRTIAKTCLNSLWGK